MINQSSVQARSSAASLLPAAILTGTLALGMALALAEPAAAYDEDVEVVCFEYKVNGHTVTECQTIDQLTAECEKTDPEFTTDVCQGLLEGGRPDGIGLTTQQRRDRNDVQIDTDDRGKEKDGRGAKGDRGDGGRDGGARDPGGRDPGGNNNGRD